MKLKVLTAVFDPQAGVFNDDAIQSFQAEHDVIDVQSQFFHHDGYPIWTVLVRYRGDSATAERREKRDWRATLDDAGKQVYDRLRTWRADRAKEDGLSAFVVLTNRQMAAVASTLPKTIAALRQIDGIGEKTADRYGTEVLALLRAPKKGASS